MVEMCDSVVARVALPVTVKTRIGWGDEQHMPIVDLADVSKTWVPARSPSIAAPRAWGTRVQPIELGGQSP